MVNDNKIVPPPQLQYRGKQSSSDNNIVKFAGIALVVALIVLIGYSMLTGGIASKKYVDANLTKLTELQNQLNASKTALDTAIANLPATIASQVNTSAGAVTNRISQVEADISRLQTQINSVQNTDSNLQSTISQINSEIDELKTQVVAIVKNVTDLNTSITEKLDALGLRITAIEAKFTTPTTTATDLVKVSVKQQSPYLVPYITSTENVSIAYLRITITNSTGKDIENVVVGLGFDIGYGIMPTIVNITGGTLGWIQYPYSPLFWTTAGWGYTVKANDKVVFDVVAKFSNASGNIGTPQYEATANIESWDYK